MSRAADMERFAGSSPAISSLLAEGTPQSLQAAVEIARQSGYGFTVVELQAFVVSWGLASGRKLADDELDKVTGGLDWSDQR